MPRPDLWLRSYFAGLLYAILPFPASIVEIIQEIYHAAWNPLVELLDPDKGEEE